MATTPYEQLCELYKQADAQATKRHEDATALAARLHEEVVRTFHVPEALQTFPADSGKRPAVELCGVPASDAETIEKIQLTSLPDAVTTNDGERYRFGIAVRLRAPGRPHCTVVFLVQMKHTINDRFEVQLPGSREAAVYSAKGNNPEGLSAFSNHIYNTLKDYFTKRAQGELSKRPIGFLLVGEE